jgi:endonuclease/exonuclease/phosphatase family metal-dependent hydrolase
MNAKKWLAIMMIFALLLTALVGCKAPAEEESAAAGEYVESTPEEEEGQKDAPVKVDPNKEPEKIQDDYDGPTDLPTNNDKNNTPSNGNEGENNEGDEPANTPNEGGEKGEEESEVSYKAENKLSIMDYNVRCADDGPGKLVSERAPRLQKLAEQLDPDLMGFQEVTPKWRGLLVDFFSSEYDYVYKERQANGECTPIFWKKSKFEKMDEGYFWLSETPDQESKGWDAGYYRICSWVRLKIKATGAEFLYFNSHWDGSDVCHLGSAALTFARARKAGAFSKYAMFLTADFNMIPWSKGYSALVQDGDLADVNADLENDTTATTNGYNEGGNERIIDMCFYSPKKAVPVSYRVLNEKIDGGYISDHRGLLVEVAVL